MYQIMCDNEILYDIRIKERLVLSPVLDLEVGKNGTLSFQIPISNDLYNTLKQKLSIIKVLQSDKINGTVVRNELFRGTAYSESIDFYKRKQVDCEGELSFFNDSVVRPYEYQGNVENLFKQYVNNHNSLVGPNKRFVPRRCTVTDPNDYITRANINYPTTKSEMDEKLLGILGGHFETSELNGTRYIDYLEEYENTSSQIIEFGKNLLDIKQFIKTEEVATRIIPLGAKNEETGEYLTIKSVNNGLDYIQDDSAVALFGVIEKKVIFEDVTLAQNLLTKGQTELQNIINQTVSIELNASDLHNLDVNIEAFRIGEYVRVISKPHGLDRYFLLSKLHLELDKPSSCAITLGATFKTLTQKQIEKEKTLNADVIVATQTAQTAKTTADNTKTELDSFIIDVPTNTEFETFKQEINQKVASVYRVCGSVANYQALVSKTGMQIGDVYNCLDTGANYVFASTGWDKLSETIDLSPYLTIANAQNTYLSIAVAQTTYATITQLADYTLQTDFDDLVRRVEILENNGGV